MSYCGLVKAVVDKDFELIKKIIQKNPEAIIHNPCYYPANCNHISYEYDCLPVKAILTESIEIVEFLFTYGMKIKDQYEINNSMIFKKAKNLEMMKLVLENGGIDTIYVRGGIMKGTGLFRIDSVNNPWEFWKKHKEAAKFVIDKVEKDFKVLKMSLIKYLGGLSNCGDLIEYAIEKGFKKGKFGGLLRASIKGHSENIIALLKNNTNPKKIGQNLLTLAIESKVSIEAIKLLIEKGETEFSSNVMISIMERNDIDILNLIMVELQLRK